MTKLVSHQSQRQSGRTLLELMISLVIGLIIIGALLIIYLSTGSAGRQSTSVSRMNEDAAISLSFLTSNLRMAGFSQPRVNASPAAATVDGKRLTSADRNFVGAGIRGCDNGFANVSDAATLADLTCATVAGSSAFAIRFEGQTNGLLPELRNTLLVGTNATDCLAQGVAANTASSLTGSSNFALVESRYFVRVSPSSGTNELFCAGNGNAFKPPQPLVQFVDELRVRYGVAASAGDREVSTYLTAAGVDALGGTVDDNWARVISVDVCIVMRSEGRDEAGSGNYLNCDNVSTASAGGFLRRSYRTLVTLRNQSTFARTL